MTNSIKTSLPPGQSVTASFERFGLGHFAKRFPSQTKKMSISIKGDIQNEIIVNDVFASLDRLTQVSDFHCVTTWSSTSLIWSGVRFRDFYQALVVAQCSPKSGANLVVFRGQDGYACSMHLEDLLADDVLLADQLNGTSLGVEHGAPLRLVAPAHYGYKSVKHIHSIEFWSNSRNYRFPLPYPSFMDHPRARVAFEERTRFFPNWIIRPLYKALVAPTRQKHRRALAAYKLKQPK